MSSYAWNDFEEWELSKYISSQVYNRASGEYYNQCQYNYPRDVYFIGNIKPITMQNNTQSSVDNELSTKISPVAFGADFRVSADRETLAFIINLSWNCYYRIFPTYQQQLNHQHPGDNNEQEENDINVDSINEDVISELELSEDIEEENDTQTDAPVIPVHNRRRVKANRDSLFIVFKKVNCSAQGEVQLIRANGEWSIDTADLTSAISLEISRTQDIILSDPLRIKTGGAIDTNMRVPDNVLLSETDYITFINSFNTTIIPQWRWDIRVNIHPDEVTTDNAFILNIEFINSTFSAENPSTYEPFFFNAVAKFIFTNCIVLPFELELAPKGFRYNKDMMGRGFNCAICVINSSEFETSNTPIYTQMRYKTRTTPPALFADLATDPVPLLRDIYSEMLRYIDIWEQERRVYIARFSDWASKYEGEFNNNLQNYNDEISLFEQGLNLIANNTDVLLAFKLTNETFKRGDPGKISWRLFQIVFLVTQIPGIYALANPISPYVDERKKVDIIYFPTGGGKTEAYLATLVFHCFFDRLRGKTAGVTVWTRFPLRLLTLQQTQRLGDVIGIAELVRKEQTDARLSGQGIDGFAVGYFVGKEATPNEIYRPRPGCF